MINSKIMWMMLFMRMMKLVIIDNFDCNRLALDDYYVEGDGFLW